MTSPSADGQSSEQLKSQEGTEMAVEELETFHETDPTLKSDYSSGKRNSPAQGMGSAAPGGEQPKLASGAVKPLESLRKFWLYGLIAALLVAVAGGFLIYKKKSLFTYSVMAKVRIAPRFSTVLSEQKETDLESFQKWRQFQEQQTMTVKRYDIVLAALKTLILDDVMVSLPAPGNPEVFKKSKNFLSDVKENLKKEIEFANQVKELERELKLESMQTGESNQDKPDAQQEGVQSDDDGLILNKLTTSDQDNSNTTRDTPEVLELKNRLKEKTAELNDMRIKDELDLRPLAESWVDTLLAVAVKDSYLINVSAEQTMKEAFRLPLDIIINRIVQTYIDRSQSESFFSDKDARLNILENRKNKVRKLIKDKMMERTLIAQKIGVTTFNESTPNPHDQLLVDSQSALAEAQRQLDSAKSSLSVFVDENGHEKREAIEAESLPIVAGDITLNTLKGNVNLRRTELLKSGSGLEDTHPLKKNIDRELKEVEEELNRGTKEVAERVNKILLAQRRNEVTKTEGKLRGIQAQIKQIHNEAKVFSESYNKALGLNNEIKRYQNQLEKIENRMDDLLIESTAPSMVRWESKALPTGKGKDASKKFKIIVPLASLIFGLLVPILVDFIKAMGEMRTTNQLQNLIGHKPLAGFCESDESFARRLVLADILRKLAIALEHEHKLNNVRLFLFTSVKPGAGVTGLALQLAQEFGDLGVRALVVEVNAFKPDPRYHDDQFQTGLIDLINGEGSIEEAISKAEGMLPDRLGVGYPFHPHLYNYDKLRNILASLKTRYDVILLDAPPILNSSDTEFLCAMADLTLMLVKAREVKPHEVRRAVATLMSLEPEAVSFIVTNLEVYKWGGYFAQREKEYNAAHEEAKVILRNNPIKPQDSIPGMKPILLYALHSGNLYGTERMALYTLEGLRDTFIPVLLTPPGPAMVEAERLGIQVVPFRSARDFARRLRQQLSDHKQIAFAATGVRHSLVFNFWNFFYRRQAVHLHLVHGGTDERESYGRKKSLNGKKVTFVAVSDYVRERLIANGVNPSQIVVVGNFLPDRRIQDAPRRPPFEETGIRKIIVVSRVDPIKRVDLLLDALDRYAELREFEFRVFGTGWDYDVLKARAQETHPNVAFEGFSPDVAGELASSDLLLHLCPVEPFGLAILEAMAAGVPVLVPDNGGAAGLVKSWVSGFHFHADDPDDLAATLIRLRGMPVDELNRIVLAAGQRLQANFSSTACLGDYRKLFKEFTDA